MRICTQFRNRPKYASSSSVWGWEAGKYSFSYSTNTAIEFISSMSSGVWRSKHSRTSPVSARCRASSVKLFSHTRGMGSASLQRRRGGVLFRGAWGDGGKSSCLTFLNTLFGICFFSCFFRGAEGAFVRKSIPRTLSRAYCFATRSFLGAFGGETIVALLDDCPVDCTGTKI